MIVLLASLVLAAASSAEPLESLPFTYYGRIVDYRRFVAGAGEATIKAYDADGRLVAKAVTFASDATDCNYRLAVPVATAPAKNHVCVGDVLTFRISSEDGVFASLVTGDNAVVGASGGGRRVDLMLAEDSDGDGVSDQYVREIRSIMRRNGYTVWDPNADWDNDGFSNAAEFVAGTSPFSADDRLSIRSQTVDGDEDLIRLTFFANAGRTYSVRGASRLGPDADWERRAFRTDDGAAPQMTVTVPSSREEGETRTLLVPKDPAATSGFYRLEVQ